MESALSLLGGSACVVVPIAFVVLVVLLARAQARRTAERRQTFAAWAAQREWEYRPADPAVVGRFRGDPFGRGSQRRATNVVLGRHDGRHFAAFDYHWTTSSGDHSTSHVASVLAMNLGVTAPDLGVVPSSLLGRLFRGFASSPYATGDPEFDRLFLTSSPSPEFARDVLTRDVMDLALRSPGLSWRITGDSLLVVREGAHYPAELDAKLAFMDALLDRIPQHVWDRLRGETPR
jgi:hypothetical protein